MLIWAYILYETQNKQRFLDLGTFKNIALYLSKTILEQTV